MRILLSGADGQLGREANSMLASRGELLCTTLEGVDGSEALDLADDSALHDLLQRFRPDLIFNAAAYTAVDRAEEERDLAHAINGEAPGHMARWAAQAGAGLVHFSTDYVFDGRKGAPYREADSVAPINVYGESKLAGERAVQASGCRHVILRTSWVYASHGANFVLKMLELGRNRDSLNVVSDQVGRPTWAANLARYAMAAVDAGLLDEAELSLLHASDAGAMSWFEFAHLIFDTALAQNLIETAPTLHEVGSDAFPTPARRPASSVLGTGLLRERVGIDPTPVKDSLAACLGQLNTLRVVA
ncbi:MAG: dTDP-4-dehydrorhamnose reductase [Pseudomonadota bacterium]